MVRCARLLLLYSLKDAELVEQLQQHFAAPVRAGQVSFLFGLPGDQIDDPAAFKQADLILVLLSPSFVASPKCDSWIEASLRSQARVIPVLLRPCFLPAALAQLLSLPQRPVTEYLDPDAALLIVVKDLCVLLHIPVGGTAFESQGGLETRVLHCADHHFSTAEQAEWCAQQLVEDLQRLRCSALDGLVLP